jgi:hypothetical protein
VFVLPNADLILVRSGLATPGPEPAEDWDLAGFVEAALDAVATQG